MSWTKQSKLEDFGYGQHLYGEYRYGYVWVVWNELTKAISSWGKQTKQSNDWIKV
jgi:hypothetical protein